MVELLFFLLPIAFFSGWKTARKQEKKISHNNRKLSDNFVKGINYLLNEQPDKALEVFLSHPEIDEYTAETYRLLGNMFRNRGEVNRALSLHQNLIARPNMSHKQRVASMLAYGEDFFAAGMLDRAESVFQELLKNEENSPQARKTLRNIYEQLKDWNKAIEVTSHSSDTTLKEQQNRLIAHYYCELAEVELAKGHIHHVEVHIEHAAKINQQSTRVKVIQGDLLLRINDQKAALSQYCEVIQSDPRLIGMLGDKIITTAESEHAIEKVQLFLLDEMKQHYNTHMLEFLTKITIKHGAPKEILQAIETLITQHTPSLRTIYGLIKLWEKNTKQMDNEHYNKIIIALDKILTEQPDFQCHHCGYRMQSYLWRCPACHHWDTVTHL